MVRDPICMVNGCSGKRGNDLESILRSIPSNGINGLYVFGFPDIVLLGAVHSLDHAAYLTLAVAIAVLTVILRVVITCSGSLAPKIAVPATMILLPEYKMSMKGRVNGK